MSSYLCRWLSLPQSLSSTGLYGNSNQLKLPFSPVREDFIVIRAQEHLQYSESRDTKMCGAERKLKAPEAVQQAETQLKHRAILGNVAQGRAELRSLTMT